MSEDDLIVEVVATGDRTTVTVTGEIDVGTVAKLEGALREIHSAAVELNLVGVTFCDSQALECLIRNKVAFRDSRRRFTLTERSAVVDRLVTLTNTERFFGDD